MFEKFDEPIATAVSLQLPENQVETVSPTQSTASLAQPAVAKTELASLLDGSSLKRPASVNAIILWQCKATHPTDLDVRKGERVKILYRNGELAFVENGEKKQGFVPLGYCSLYRRRSSSLSDLSVETARKIASVDEPEQLTDEKAELRLEQNQQEYSGKEMAFNAVKTKKLGKMVSKGSYDTRKAENNSKKRQEKGIFNNAAKKLMKAFTSSITSKTKAKTRKSISEKKPVPEWLMQLNFDNNNPEFSSSSDSSDDNDDDSAYESFRTSNETRPTVVRRKRSQSTTLGVPMRNSLLSMADDYFEDRGATDQISTAENLRRQNSTQDVTTGFANVRKLRTSSRSGVNGVSRSRSFNLDTKTRTLHRVLQRRPKDLLDGSDCENQSDENEIFEERSIKRVPSHDCMKYDKFSVENLTVDQHENVMVVLQDFFTQDNKDLKVLEGQKVRVLNRNDENWWLCEAENGRGGFVPRSYLAPYDGRGIIADFVDSNFLRNRSDWQESSFRAKTASVKLARITPMAREPLQHGSGNMASLKRDGIGRRKRESWNRVGTEDFRVQISAETECSECLAACSMYDSSLVVGKSRENVSKGSENVLNCEVREKQSCEENCQRDESGYTSSWDEQMTVEKAVGDKAGNETNVAVESEKASETQMCKYEGGQSQEKSEKDVSPLKEERSVVEQESGRERRDSEKRVGAKSHATEVGNDVIRALPSYDQIIEQRKLEERSEIRNHVKTQMNDMHEKLEGNQVSSQCLVEKLLDEWRSEQKKFAEKLPTLERRTSSDSQSTVSDAADAGPRLLRRRNSTNRRVRFQNPDNPKICESSPENVTTTNGNGMHNGPILATWL